MEVLQDGEEFVFLYQLVEGKTDTSYACHIAAMMGLASELVKRGAKVRVQNNFLENNFFYGIDAQVHTSYNHI